MPLAHPNATLRKFGYPRTLLEEGEHWAVLVRPAQPTLGSLILCSTSEATSYGELPVQAFVEQHRLVARIEQFIGSKIKPERINYLMLMMVDPHVHFHVVPRYPGAREWGGTEFIDAGWPAMPDLGRSIAANDDLIHWLHAAWMPQVQ